MAIVEFSNVFVPFEPHIAITAYGSVAATWTYEPYVATESERVSP
jgi:hypothetical protein